MTTPIPTDNDRPLVDVRDMLVVHTAMLREFRLAPGAVRRTAAADRRRATMVATHVEFIGSLLHHHHQGEDDLLWPKLRARSGPSAVKIIDEVESQHEAIDAALDRVESLRRSWAQDPSTPVRDRLAAELESLFVLLRDHLDLEEQALLPLAAATLTIEEWLAVGEAGAASIPKSALPLVFGMFAYEGDPAVLADMLKAAPVIPRTVVPLIAPRIYARYARRIYGTSRP